MASTKEMQARAKARKQAEKQPEFRINEHKFLEVMVRLTDLMIKENPNQDYGQTATSLWTAKEMVKRDKLNAVDFQQLLGFRERFEQGLEINYNVHLASGLCAFTQDPESLMKSAGVPQNLRIMSGFLDTLISVLGFNCGAIKIQSM